MKASSLWIVAGEASGDLNGVELMQAIKAQAPSLRLLGAGGPKMAALADGRFDNWIAEAGVLGLWDVLKRYPYFRKKFAAMVRHIEEEKPEAVVLIDYPGFNLRLAAELRRRKLPLKIIYYISPQVWAWNKKRIPKMARILDLMLCIFPFEKALYEASGLKTEFVGHPLLERLSRELSGEPRDPRLVGLFPGSREREVKRLFPVFLAAAGRLHAAKPELYFEVAAASEAHRSSMEALRAQTAPDLPMKIHVGQSHALMQRAAFGIVCSGTATLEAAFFGLPYCLVYKVAWLTFEVGKRLVNIQHLGIVNILAGRTVITEYIQHFCTPEALAQETMRFMDHPSERDRLTAELRQVINSLDGVGASQRAAQAILSTL